MTGYSGAANPAVAGRLREFYTKSDSGRAGDHGTEL